MMKKKSALSSEYQVYDLSNPHLKKVEIITTKDEHIRGQFVKFKVNENSSGYKIYPSEKFCFLPLENAKEFWDSLKTNKGIFSEFPLYIKELGLNDIRKIIIEPVLVD